MNFIIHLIFLTGLISFPHSSDIMVSQGSVKFYLDYAVFDAASGVKKLEFYYLVELRGFKSDTSGHKILRYYFFLESNGKKPVRQSWKQHISSRDGQNYLIDQLSLLVTSGKYHVRFVIEDSLDAAKGVIDTVITVPKSDTLAPFSASDIEFLWNVSKDTIPDFFKYGLSFIPNPVRSYSPQKDTLLYFYEIYSKDTCTLVLNSLIYREDGTPVLRSSPEIIKVDRKHVGIGAILLDGINDEGEYTLVLDFTDLSHKRHIQVETPFYYTFGEKEISPELIDYISFIDYIASPKELRKYHQIKDEKAKYLFLKKFWAKRDPNPKTSQNEFLQEFIARVKEADRKYTRFHKKGRYTDRGRILIKYGEPDEIKRISMEGPRPDMEKWYYYDENWVFIFADIQNNGDYKLVYSSNKDEPGLPDWRRYISEEEIRGQ